MDLQHLTTEGNNPHSRHIDQCSTEEILNIINSEDSKVAPAVAKNIPAMTQAVDSIVAALRQGGRLIYIGAGTSGRLGILDASECPPTYSTNPEQIIGLIAGGREAVFRSVEHAEDDATLGEADLKAIHFCTKDILVGIAASGRTPYVIGALHYARELGAITVGISCTENSPVQQQCDIAITPIVGAEVVSGSTRMKAGTAQKLVLNMLTTTAMIKLGKVYQNLMVDVKPSNSKLIQRQKNIICAATGCTEDIATDTLRQADGEAKVAILMLLLNLDATTARNLLTQHHGVIREALDNAS